MRLVVARIGRAHGIRGEVTVEVRTDAPERRLAPGEVLHVIPGNSRGAPSNAVSPLPPTVTVASARDHNGTLLLGFERVADRTAADALRGCLLEADIAEDEPAEPDAWYDHQLIGLRAQGTAGEPLGEIVAVEHPGAQDLLVLRRPDGARRLVPFVRAIVPTVDVDAGYLVLDPPGGLL